MSCFMNYPNNAYAEERRTRKWSPRNNRTSCEWFELVILPTHWSSRPVGIDGPDFEEDVDAPGVPAMVDWKGGNWESIKTK